MTRVLIQECLLEGGGIESRRSERSGMALARTSSAVGAPAQKSPCLRQSADRERHSLAHPYWRAMARSAGQIRHWITVYQRFRRWSQAGIWETVATTPAHSMADNTHHSVDSTTVRAHVSAAGAKGGLANKILEGRGTGSPVKFTVSVTPLGFRSRSTSHQGKRQTAPRSKTSSRLPK